MVTVRMYSSLDGAGGAFDRILADGSRRFMVMVSSIGSSCFWFLIMIWGLGFDLDLDLSGKLKIIE